MKKCITMLVRPTDDNISGLLYRNQSINAHLTDEKSTDILIFHTGNMTEKLQQQVFQATPRLRIAFVNICKSMSLPEGVFTPEHESAFWWNGFWGLVKNYDLMLRMDAPQVDCSIDPIFDMLVEKSIVSSSPLLPLPDKLTLGLNEVSLRAFFRLNPSRKYPASGPDMSFFGINLTKLRDNLHLKRFIQFVEASDGIFLHGWSDSAIWGEAIHYLFLGDNQFEVFDPSSSP